MEAEVKTKTGYELLLVTPVICDAESYEHVFDALRAMEIFPDVVMALFSEQQDIVGYLVLHHGAYVGSVTFLSVLLKPIVNTDISLRDILERYGGKMYNYYQLVRNCLQLMGYRFSKNMDNALFSDWM